MPVNRKDRPRMFTSRTFTVIHIHTSHAQLLAVSSLRGTGLHGGRKASHFTAPLEESTHDTLHWQMVGPASLKGILEVAYRHKLG